MEFFIVFETATGKVRMDGMGMPGDAEKQALPADMTLLRVPQGVTVDNPDPEAIRAWWLERLATPEGIAAMTAAENLSQMKAASDIG